MIGLFGKDKRDESKVAEKFAPIVLRTDNVAKEILEVAKNYGVPTNEIDFTLLSVHTYTRVNDGSESEFEELYEEDMIIFDDESMLLNPQFEIKQNYEIELFHRQEDDKNEIDSAIGANSAKSSIYFTIKPGSKLHWYDAFERDLLLYIDKKKLRTNILIKIFDKVMYDSIRPFVAKLRVDESLELKEKEMLHVAQAIDPIATRNDKLLLNYEKKNEALSEQERIDYAKRGYISSVVKGEVIITYIKAKEGRPGRNCRGEYIAPSEPKISQEPTFSVTEKIEIKEDEDKIEYIAKESGYVLFEGGLYDIKQDVEVSEISFKTTGSIETDLDADVSINVKESDVFKDAIGMGMDVEVSELNVDGNVGPNATIRANKVEIKGQTHKSSKINAKEVDINIHKGLAEGEHIHVTRLEHGEIVCAKASVVQALGGTIRASEIEVETLGSHNTLMASHRIEITKFKGSENSFIIDPVLRRSGKKELEKNEKEIHEAKIALRQLDKEIAQKQERLDANEKSFNELKKRLLHYKKNGVKIPSAFLAKYKQFQAAYAEVDALKKERRQKSEHIELMAAKHDAYQGDIFSARIIVHVPWSGHNEIKFKLIEPEVELSYVPKPTDKRVFGLKKDEDDEIVIAQFDS